MNKNPDLSSEETKFMYDIFQKLSSYQQQDYNISSGHILGSMITKIHPIAKQAYMQFIETNIGDPGLCPGTKQMEAEFIEFLRSLLHAPKQASGHIVSGGTEGNITAMWIAKELSKKKEIIIPASAHFSFQKIASLMSVRVKILPLTKSYMLDIANVKKSITRETAAVVGIAGSTDLGTIDPIEQLGEICAEEQIFLHIDAAFGGFVIPFLRELGYPVGSFDFSIPGVSSISIDAHKMGQAPIPLGTVLLREQQWIEEISVHSPCISIDKQAGFLGTRSGGPLAAGYAMIQYLGHQGFRKIIKGCMEATQYATKRIEEIGLSLVTPPTMNLIAVRLQHPQKIATALEQRKWKVNAMPHLQSIRIVCMPHVTPLVLDEFIPVLENICKKEGEL